MTGEQPPPAIMNSRTTYRRSQNRTPFVLHCKGCTTGLTTVSRWYNTLVQQTDSSYDLKQIVRHSYDVVRVPTTCYNVVHQSYHLSCVCFSLWRSQELAQIIVAYGELSTNFLRPFYRINIVQRVVQRGRVVVQRSKF